MWMLRSKEVRNMKNTPTHLTIVALSFIGMLLLFSCDNLRNGNTTTSDMATTRDSTGMEAEPPIEVQEHETPSLVLDEMGMFDDDDPIIYFVASVNKAKYAEWQYIYADGPDSVAFIKVDGKRQLLKTLESDVFENGDDDYSVKSFSQNEDYEVRVFQKLMSQEEGSANWTGHITVTRRADGAIFKSDIYATSSH